MGGCISRQEEIINTPNALGAGKFANGLGPKAHNQSQNQTPGQHSSLNAPGSFQKTFNSPSSNPHGQNSAALSPIPNSKGHHGKQSQGQQNGGGGATNLRSKPSNAQNSSQALGDRGNAASHPSAGVGNGNAPAGPKGPAQLGTNSAPWDSHNIGGGAAVHNPARSIPSYHSNTTNNTTNRDNPGGSNSAGGPGARANSNLALANSNNRYTNHNRNSNTANQSATNNTQNSASSSKTPSQVSSTDRIFVALYDYAARTDADLSFRRGDKMEILDRSGGGWWMAKHMDPQAILNRGEIRDRGYVPSNFIAKYRSLESYDWYFGQIRRNEAERTLMNPMAGVVMAWLLI